MSVINYIDENIGNGIIIITWPNMGDDDTGQPWQGAACSDKSVQAVAAVWGSATLTIEATNEDDAASPPVAQNFGTIQDFYGADLSFTTDRSPIGIAPIAKYIRPKTAGGTSTDVTVTMVGKITSLIGQ